MLQSKINDGKKAKGPNMHDQEKISYLGTDDILDQIIFCHSEISYVFEDA
jgi:hypothetical protein